MFVRPIVIALAVVLVCASNTTAQPVASPSPAVLPVTPTPTPIPAPTPTPTPAPDFRFEFIDVERAIPLVAGSTVLDTRPLAKYLAGHIPGAIRLSDEAVREASGSLPTAMLPSDRLAELFGRLGVVDDKPALVYSDHEDPLAATLVAYALLKAGHPHVRVLDGGFTAWQGSGPATQDFTTVTPRLWTRSPNTTLAATLDDVREALRTEEVALIDARPPKFYRGEGKAWKRNGHIPGATNLDWHTLVNADNESLMKAPAAIRDVIKASKASPDDPTIVYCGTGREATLLFLTLRTAPGWRNVRLYEGSWTEYQSHADLPAEIGSEPGVAIYTDGTVSTSGQPSERTIRMLADRGTRVIVNCRTPGETREVGFAERAIVESAGMKYVEIPLGGSEGYNTQDVEKLHAIITEHGGTTGLHLHCAGGPRASTLWAAYLVRYEGLTAPAAIERLRKAGMLRESSLERLVGETLLPTASR